MIDTIIKKLKDKNIAILGFGIEGKSTYNFIRRYLPNQKITILDKLDVSNNNVTKNDSNVNFVCGDNYLDNLIIYDVIIKTPGISLNSINVDNIKNKITSQLELMLEVDKENIIGITGTKGKSTTTSLIYNCFKSNNKDVYLLGNIGNPLFDNIERYTTDTKLIVEMSSHQLEYIEVSPHVGIILNLFEDHLDHAGNVEHYHQCKLNMFKYMTKDDISIYALDNDTLNNYIKNSKFLSKKLSVSLSLDSDVYIKDQNVMYKDEILYSISDKRNLIGSHNLENIMFALVVAKLYDLDMDKCRKSINDFKPLEHRLEYVGKYNDIIYYNDTIATIPEATIKAIESLHNVNTLIFGGMDRHINYNNFIDYLNNCNVENLICMPKTGHDIGGQINGKKVYFVQTLEEAVDLAKKITKKNTICLLSPAASSYEYFKNFIEKGNAFKELVRS